jgi:predicted SprT family Zn-dependent metalloprotease
MPLLRQLEFAFEKLVVAGIVDPGGLVAAQSDEKAGVADPGYRHATRVASLEEKGRELLRMNGTANIARSIRVEWNSRLKTCAGRADYRQKRICLNPKLREHPAEIDRTLRHELAHILAQVRAGRRRILPHGLEWRQACRDLGIADEKRCHNLPFPASERARRYLYRCPHCQRDFLRVHRIQRAVACLACCRAHNDGVFDSRFKLMLVDRDLRARC